MGRSRQHGIPVALLWQCRQYSASELPAAGRAESRSRYRIATGLQFEEHAK